MFKCKITFDQITYGPKTDSLESSVAMAYAQELKEKGYRKTSNAYCIVSRIDREDWLEVLAKQMRCSVAHFYNADGSGISDHWRDHYVRCFSKDKHTVHPDILKFIPTYF
jgi:hypothetical protein